MRVVTTNPNGSSKMNNSAMLPHLTGVESNSLLYLPVGCQISSVGILLMYQLPGHNVQCKNSCSLADSDVMSTAGDNVQREFSCCILCRLVDWSFGLLVVGIVGGIVNWLIGR